MAQHHGVQLEKATRRARRASARVKELEAEVAALRERAGVGEQAAADQHTAMVRQDHVHAEQIAVVKAGIDALTGQVSRLIDTWAAVLKKAGTPC